MRPRPGPAPARFLHRASRTTTHRSTMTDSNRSGGGFHLRCTPCRRASSADPPVTVLVALCGEPPIPQAAKGFFLWGSPVATWILHLFGRGSAHVGATPDLPRTTAPWATGSHSRYRQLSDPGDARPTRAGRPFGPRWARGHLCCLRRRSRQRCRHDLPGGLGPQAVDALVNPRTWACGVRRGRGCRCSLKSRPVPLLEK